MFDFLETIFFQAKLVDAYFISALLTGIVIASIPLLLASFGEMFSQEAGMLNLGIEGIMLAGAFTAFYIAFIYQSLQLAFLGAAFVGILLSLFIAFCYIKLMINQVIVGVSITFAMQGLTALLHKTSFSSSYPRLEKVQGFSIPYFSEIPYIGQAFFGQPHFVFFSILCICFISFFYNKSILKLHVKALGFNQKALEVSGVNSNILRIFILLFTGLMASQAGAYLSVIASGVFVPFMTNGTGFIAIVLAMLAKGRTIWLFLSSFLFGICLSFGTILQLMGSSLSTDFLYMLPFLSILFLLVWVKE